MVPKFVDAGARRQEIVEAVFRIVAVDGLDRASLREVAEEAGLVVGSVRHYFGSSDELLVFSFATVIDRIVRRLEVSLSAVGEIPAGTPAHRDAVLTLLGQLLPLDEELAVDACVWMAFRHAARTRPVLAEQAGRSHRSVAAVVGRLVMELAPGTAGGPELVTEAERLLATLDGLCMHALLQPEWMTARMCRDVLDRHLDTFGGIASAR